MLHVWHLTTIGQSSRVCANRLIELLVFFSPLIYRHLQLIANVFFVFLNVSFGTNVCGLFPSLTCAHL